MNKLYVCMNHPALSLGGILHFTNGRYETAEPDKQALIENSKTFKNGHITWADKVAANAVRIVLPVVSEHAGVISTDPEPSPPEPVAPEPEKKFLSRLSRPELVVLALKNGIEGADEKTRSDLYDELKKIIGKGKVVAGLA
jgi:hypothetical protein